MRDESPADWSADGSAPRQSSRGSSRGSSVGSCRRAAVEPACRRRRRNAPARVATADGLELLLTRAYLPADFDQDVFDALWTTWEEPLRSRAERLDVAGRRRLAMERYGLLPHPDDPSRSLQYAVDAAGNWTMNCLACHQGQVRGVAIPGVPNSSYALETLTEEVRLVKARQRKAFGHMDMGSLFLPLGTTVGTTNAVIFGMALMRHRDPQLNIVPRPPRLDLPHHDMDAPAWWLYRTRPTLYADGFAAKGHRMLMQFLLVKENGPERFREWEDDFRHIEAWIEGLDPPAWNGPLDEALAARGQEVFATHCAECHGTYGAGRSYPDRVVPIDVIGTDQARLNALTSRSTATSTRVGSGTARGPGSTTAAIRPDMWRLRSTASGPRPPTCTMDRCRRSGTSSIPPSGPSSGDGRRPATTTTGSDSKWSRPTRCRRSGSCPPRDAPGSTRAGRARAGGHEFVDALDAAEKSAVLEYLKTL